VPRLSDFFDRVRELFRPSQRESTHRAGGDSSERENIEEIARDESPHPWDDPWYEGREKPAESEAPAPDDESQGVTLPEPPPIPEKEPDADGRSDRPAG
jgi:hypothetical protein